MAIGEHKTIAVGPLGIVGIVFEISIPKNFCNVRHTHRGARVTTIGRLYGIHT